MVQTFPQSSYATTLHILDEALKRSASQRTSFTELRLYDYTELQIDYCPSINASIERSGNAWQASARVWNEGRMGFASGTVLGARDLATLLDTAREASCTAALCPQPLAVPVALPVENSNFQELSGERARRQAKMLADALCQVTNGKIQTLLVRQLISTITIANSAGLRVIEHVEGEEVLLRCETLSGAVVDGMIKPSLGGLWDMGPLIERLQTAFDTVEYAGVSPDPHLPMLLRPAVAAPLVAGLAWLLRGDTAAHTPGLAAALTHKIFPSHLTVCDDPEHPQGTRLRHYDDEGQPSVSLSLIQDGRIMNFLHSTQSAEALASQSNGHGFIPRAGRPARPVPQEINLYIRPASLALPDTYLDLTAKLETLKSMPRAGLVTMTVAGWIVCQGERIRRVHSFDLHLPLLPTWRRLTGVADDLCFLSCADGCGTPSLLFPSLLSEGVS